MLQKLGQSQYISQLQFFEKYSADISFFNVKKKKKARFSPSSDYFYFKFRWNVNFEMLKPEEKLKRVNEKSGCIFEVPKQNTFFFLLLKKNFLFALRKLMKFLIVFFHDMGKNISWLY